MVKQLSVYFVALILIFIIGIFVYPAYQSRKEKGPEPSKHIIKLTNSGFYPEELVIHREDAVVFITTGDNYFWPASNIHPVHTIYQEFDPRKPIPPDGRWVFRFDKIGQWQYHDHLAPHNKGTIIVLDKESRSFSYSLQKLFSEKGCQAVDNQEQCWLNLLEDALSRKGLDAAFNVFEKLYEKEPNFSSSCHEFGHRLGEAAYGLFSRDEDFVITPKTAYCSYGFYHGFMESLLSSTGDLRETKNFCDRVNKKLGKVIPDAPLQCYHGIGHGAIDLAATEFYNDSPKKERALVSSALQLCKEVSRSDPQQSRCATGVFNGIAFLYINQPDRFPINKDDPLWLCYEEQTYERECYISMNVALLWFSGNDFIKATEFVEEIENDNHAGQATLNLAALIATQDPARDNHMPMISDCRSIQARLRLWCIQGYAFGFLERGEPGKEYIRAFGVCYYPLLSEKEKTACFEYLSYYLNLWYSYEKTKSICSTIKESYRDLCYSQLKLYRAENQGS
ncbi:hypothetical protein IIA95_03095 [Patescibacteria group bacterium]|nr:hypothetical protein [Patescibacteria group bacterium]